MAPQWVFMQVFQVLSDAPLYHVFLEGGLLIGVLWLLFHKSYNPKDFATFRLTDKEKQKLIQDWTPEPLVAPVPQNHPALEPRVITGKAGKYVELNGHNCLNMATHNYLDFIGNEQIEANAIKTLAKYGVGSCGPRGFYGTVDVHLELEERLAKFMNLEEAAVYSYGFSTIASAIPSYAKRADVIFVDENVNFAIQKGLDASRSRIQYFAHNDMADLERLLIQQEALDFRNVRKAMKTRRFLVVEGIYINSGDLCPLPQLIELRKKYKLRIFVDENISFGSLGATGHGITEHFDIPREEVDLIVSGMETSMATIGGFCVGSSFIVEHQRLSGLGYCFSASLPPLLATAAITSLDLMEEDPSMFERLKTRCCLVQNGLKKIKGLSVGGDPVSPVKHLYLADETTSMENQKAALERIVDYCEKNGLAVVLSSYLENAEKFSKRPSIRITVNNTLTTEEIETASAVLQRACNENL